ncbi:MAG: serine/threonine protein kinase [Myxococcales bacterium]|nr:serine/threonine protein kinase [Myxococcales bacterium]
MTHALAERAVELGQLVGGRFRVEGTLGEGGMAHVYAARDERDGTEVALKLLKPGALASAEIVSRFEREAEALSRLDHPAVVKLVARGFTDSGQLYLAMERLVGETLRARLDRGPLSLEELAPIVAGVAVGLEAAHAAGILHRDLKPENVFLAKSPRGGEQVKILDFGISKLHDQERLTRTGQVIGTPRYMAPEQLEAKRDLDGRVDVYALGVILYEALAFARPFAAKNPSDLVISILMGRRTPLAEHRPDLPREVVEVVERAFARDRDERFRTPLELAQAVTALLPGASSGAAKVTTERILRGEEVESIAPLPSETADELGRTDDDLVVPGLEPGFPWFWTAVAFAVGGALAYALLSLV